MPKSDWIPKAAAGQCPGCGCSELVAGPVGGASRNVYCPNCHEGWNLHGATMGTVVSVDALGPVTHDTILWALKVYRDDQPFRLRRSENDNMAGE
jgi:hypothetical protein